MKTRDLIYCALFAALTAIGAFIHFQFMHATITLQCFFTAMAGLLLGARLGALSQALYVGLGLVGLPIFAAGGGFSYVFNPTFGFLLGLIPAAWVIGRLAEKPHAAASRACLCRRLRCALRHRPALHRAHRKRLQRRSRQRGKARHGLYAALSPRRLPEDRRQCAPCPAYSQGNGKKFIKILPQSCKCNFAKLQILCYTKLTKASNLKIPTKIKWRIRI